MSSAKRRGVTLRRYSEVKPLRKHVTGISFEALLIFIAVCVKIQAHNGNKYDYLSFLLHTTIAKINDKFDA